MTAHSLEVRRLRKEYGSAIAVNDVTLKVPGGQFLTLLGPSGSGKTTILMTIAGFSTPTAGDILLDDAIITPLPPEKRNFGMVFQGYALFPHLDVAHNVAFPLRVRGITGAEAEAKVSHALDLVQLGHLKDRLPRQLSGGQQQRVALARALVFDPAVLLLDEPLSALDKKLRADLQWELKAIHERVGTTFIYVTHDQEEALSMSDRIAILNDGQIAQLGSPTELYEAPATRFVADFLGKSNFIEGRTVRQDGSDLVYQAGGGEFRQANSTGSGGEPILVALRPEKIDVRNEPPTDGLNTIEGRLSSWNYYGTNFQLRVATDALGDVLVNQPAFKSPIEPQQDASVWLSWEPDASVVVKPD
ncbi:ABC transporter ATP-binding protein [Acuticoccus mangrovi]|uniref:Spermidine/putrescine import ATP-binding protein PotA n=1 Tax=Acuticoccus mangrovi TaxID=2796142 RepID=A0A934IKI2_9HYPH|nr:ABC transporter ATP-binding protein [Acuticoccus mangrovi]